MRVAAPAKEGFVDVKIGEMPKWSDGGRDAVLQTCGAFSGLQPGVSLQAKPSRDSSSPSPVQQGLA
uniref:Uncharacterized protein n=1 Tax=Fagus sylvatica TaxID=28930 RepID=A0A2N9GXH8_FAGSY